MSVADKLLQLNQVKQDIKTAIENKGVSLSNVPFTQYHEKIAEISVGEELDLFLTAAKKYHEANLLSDLEAAWQKKVDSETILYNIPITRVAENQEMQGIIVDLYIGDLTQLYNDCQNGTLPQSIDTGGIDFDYVLNYIVNDFIGVMVFESEVYYFYGETKGVALFDYNGTIMLAVTANSGLIDNLIIRKGFIRGTDETTGIIVSDLVTEISTMAFFNYETNNKPLVLPNTITAIGRWAFAYWVANTHPLTIPNSVVTIRDTAFSVWRTCQKLEISSSIELIESSVFYNWDNLKEITIYAKIPPVLEIYNFYSSGSLEKIKVPAESVDAYKTADGWNNFANKIVAIE